MPVQRLIAVIAVAIALAAGIPFAQTPAKVYTVELLFAGPPGGSILGPELERDFAQRDYVLGGTTLSTMSDWNA